LEPDRGNAREGNSRCELDILFGGKKVKK